MNTKQVLKKLLEDSTDSYKDKLKYTPILFSAEGDWITCLDCSGSTIDEVKNKLANRSSRDYYPFEGIIEYITFPITSSERIIEMAPPLEFLSGKTIDEISKHIKRIYDAMSKTLE